MKNFPKEYYVNIYFDRRFGSLESTSHDSVEECYADILEGRDRIHYQETLHVWTDKDGKQQSEIDDFTQDARNWRDE